LYTGEVLIIEQNASTLQSRDTTNAEFPCSLEGLGGAFYLSLSQFPQLNFLPKNSQGYTRIEEQKSSFIKILSACWGLLVITCLISWGSIFWVKNQKVSESKKLAMETAQLSGQQSAEALKQVGLSQFVQDAVHHNIQLNNFLVNLGSLTKPGLWLSEIDIKTDNALEEIPPAIVLSGQALNLEPVNAIVQPLNKTLDSSDLLEVSNAEQQVSPENKSFFVWRIETRKKDDSKEQNKS
jgi:hypothetical protein